MALHNFMNNDTDRTARKFSNTVFSFKREKKVSRDRTTRKSSNTVFSFKREKKVSRDRTARKSSNSPPRKKSTDRHQVMIHSFILLNNFNFINNFTTLGLVE